LAPPSVLASTLAIPPLSAVVVVAFTTTTLLTVVLPIVTVSGPSSRRLVAKLEIMLGGETLETGKCNPPAQQGTFLVGYGFIGNSHPRRGRSDGSWSDLAPPLLVGGHPLIPRVTVAVTRHSGHPAHRRILDHLGIAEIADSRITSATERDRADVALFPRCRSDLAMRRSCSGTPMATLG
jgi:hypothetical protein